MEDDLFYDDLPITKVRRIYRPLFDDSPAVLMDSMSRQMANAMNRMQEDLEVLDDLLHDDKSESLRKRIGNGDSVVRRTESGGLQLALDVADFKPEDLKIKLEDDNLVIEANNEQSSENHYKKSHFKRWFKLPDGCDSDSIRSKLTSDGQLLVDLPNPKPIENNAREIPIQVERREAVTNGSSTPETNKENNSKK